MRWRRLADGVYRPAPVATPGAVRWLFADPRAAWVWFPIRLYIGWAWFYAGRH